MVQYIPRAKDTSERFAEAFGAGTGQLAGDLSKHFVDKEKTDKKRSFLSSLAPDIDWEGASPEMLDKGFESIISKMKKQETPAERERNQTAMHKFAEKLRLENPDSPLHKTIADIYDSGLSDDLKSDITKAITGLDPFKAQQQERLRIDSVLRQYNTVIKDLSQQIKETYDIDEQNRLKNERKRLQHERNTILKLNSLQELDDFDDEDEDEDIKPPPKKGKKPKFDPNNEEHRKKAIELMKKYKNKQSVEIELKKEYEL